MDYISEIKIQAKELYDFGFRLFEDYKNELNLPYMKYINPELYDLTSFEEAERVVALVNFNRAENKTEVIDTVLNLHFSTVPATIKTKKQKEVLARTIVAKRGMMFFSIVQQLISKKDTLTKEEISFSAELLAENIAISPTNEEIFKSFRKTLKK